MYAPYRKANGFTLIELMIVIAIIGILAGIGIPQYASYTKRAKYTDVISQATTYKVFVSSCVQHTNKLEGCSNNSTHIGPAVNSKGKVNSLTVTDGTILATGSQEVDGAVFKLIPTYTSSTSSLTWSLDNTVTNSCFSLGMCKNTNTPGT